MMLRKFIKQYKISLSLLALCLAVACLPLLISAITGPKMARKDGYTFQHRPVRFQTGPVMNFDFSIGRDDNTIFSGLTKDSIEAFQDGDKLPVAQGGLEDLTDTPVAAMILVDVSHSMRNPEFRKLEALKKALHGFIEGLNKGGKREERIALAAFDYQLRWWIGATPSKDFLYNAVDRLDSLDGSDNRTRLYDAIKWFLKEFKDKGVQNLIVLSDGVDSTMQDPRAKHWTGEMLASYEGKLLEFEGPNEAEIIDQARASGIRIFAIEMGITEEDYKSIGTAITKERYESMFVYRKSLGNISSDTRAGTDHYINLFNLQRGGDYDNSLSNSLGGVLEEIRKTYNYNYSLPVSLAGHVQQDGKPRTVEIKMGVGNGGFEAKVDYVWNPGEAVPREVKPPFIVWLDHKDILVMAHIYLITMAALGLLSSGPPVTRRLTEGREMRQMRRAIIKVEEGSLYIGKKCPSEGSFRRFRKGDVLLICPAPDCKLAHHLECWHQAGGMCYKRNCSLSSNPQPLPEALAKSYKLHLGSQSQQHQGQIKIEYKRIYYYFLLGAAGSLTGWFLAEISIEKLVRLEQFAIFGALLGGLIGMAVAGYDGISSWHRFMRFGGIGLLIGGLTGALASPLAQWLYNHYRQDSAAQIPVAQSILIGLPCWLLLGGMIGLGAVIGKGTQMHKGVLGGLVGALLGGLIYEIARVENSAGSPLVAALSLGLLGGAIGASVALVTTAQQSAHFEVTTGKLKGRIYDLTKYLDPNGGGKVAGLIGSDANAAWIYLQGDDKVLPRHAKIHYAEGAPMLTVFEDSMKAKMPTLINGRNVSASVPLGDGDCVQIGNTVLIYRQKRK